MSERSCTQVRADLSAYLDGDLDAGLTSATRAHLDSCNACRSELSLLRLTIDTLHRLPDLPPPAAILSGVRARLQPEPWYRRLLGGGRWHFGFPLSAAATLLVIFGISLFVARYPDMPKTVSRETSPRSPAPAAPQSPLPRSLQSLAKPARVAPPVPAERDKGADRQAAPPPAPPARGDLRAKQALGHALPPQVAAEGGGEIKDAPREESRRAENFAAAPSRGSAAFDVLDEKAGTPPSLEKKKESPELFAQKADSGASLESGRIVGEKKTAPTSTRVVCLLLPEGDTVDDLEKVLRREGAGEITISELEPPAVREAIAPHRWKLGSLPGPSRGWTVTASFPAGDFTRLLDALAGRPGLRILEKPATSAATGYLPERLDLRITVVR